MSRYNSRLKAINAEQQYKKTFDKRGIKKITQYRTLEKEVFEQEVYDSIETIDYVWKYGDMYYNLAFRIYGDPELWWVIASFNKRPTEFHNKIGDVLKIPINLSDALQVVE